MPTTRDGVMRNHVREGESQDGMRLLGQVKSGSRVHNSRCCHQIFAAIAFLQLLSALALQVRLQHQLFGEPVWVCVAMHAWHQITFNLK